MHDDELKSLLRGAEAGLEKPPFAADEFARRVRGLDRQRRNRRRTLLAATPLVAAVATFAVWRWLPSEAVGAKSDRQVARAAFDLREIERLEAEAEYHERLAHQLIAERNLDHARRQAREILMARDPLDEIREQIDVVAYRMLLRADALQAEMDPSAEATRLYHDVESLFPDSYAAEVARERLGARGESKGET